MKQHPYAKGPSPNFTWHEVNPHGFSGLGPKLRFNAITQARKLEVLRAKINKRRAEHGLDQTGIRTLSWWRPDWYNRQIHGAKYSQHIKARATDISLQEIHRLMPWGGGPAEFDALCSTIWAKGGFGQYPAGDRHVDTRGYMARWTSFRRQ
jgi:uncharacterized protein YcbK (DUF882 family)